jgi:type VI secretion system protein
MLRAITVLERLAETARGGAKRTVREDRGAVMRSVLNNLQRILNTREGSAPAHPDLGVRSPFELMQGYPQSGQAIVDAVRLCIERYEPRLANVRVALEAADPRGGVISFQVSAMLAGGDRADLISFHTAIGSDGRIRLHDA